MKGWQRKGEREKKEETEGKGRQDKKIKNSIFFKEDKEKDRFLNRHLTTTNFCFQSVFVILFVVNFIVTFFCIPFLVDEKE